jgi:hypothetical protein
VFWGQVLVDNRHGLCANFRTQDPIAEPEPVVALRQVPALEALLGVVRLKTVGGLRWSRLS